MTANASHQTSVEASEIAQAHKDQLEANGVQTTELSLSDQAFELYLQVSGEIAAAQGRAAGQKKNQTAAVKTEAFRQMEIIWDLAFKAGQNHGLELAFSSAMAPAPVNPFRTVGEHL